MVPVAQVQAIVATVSKVYVPRLSWLATKVSTSVRVVPSKDPVIVTVPALVAINPNLKSTVGRTVKGVRLAATAPLKIVKADLVIASNVALNHEL